MSEQIDGRPGTEDSPDDEAVRPRSPFEQQAWATLAGFLESDECLDLMGVVDDPGYATELFLNFAGEYFGCSPIHLDPYDAKEIVFEVFPRKVPCSPDEAAEFIAELRAFAAYLDRTEEISPEIFVSITRDGAAEMLRDELADPENFDPAKRFLKEGEAAGFDVQSEDGLRAWQAEKGTSLPWNQNAPGEPVSKDAPPRTKRVRRRGRLTSSWRGDR